MALETEPARRLEERNGAGSTITGHVSSCDTSLSYLFDDTRRDAALVRFLGVGQLMAAFLPINELRR